jgi:hypothetical protein
MLMITENMGWSLVKREYLYKKQSIDLNCLHSKDNSDKLRKTISTLIRKITFEMKRYFDHIFSHISGGVRSRFTVLNSI